MTLVSSLSPKQARLLEFIRSYTDENGCSPSQAEMADALGVSKITAREHLCRLVSKGVLHHEENKTRATRIVGRAFVPMQWVERILEGVVRGDFTLDEAKKQAMNYARYDSPRRGT